MSTGANALQPFIERRERNLAWFRKHYPQIAKHFETYKMNRWRVNILPERDEVDLLAPEGNLYGGSGRDYAHKEVQVFRDAYREGSQVRSINPPFSGEFYHPRFIHARINALISRSPLQRGNFAGYRVPDFYPMVVFLGIGLGYHIEEMVLQHDVLSALVVEPDLDKFAGSLYAVDWAGIGERIRARKGQTLHFILGSEEQEDLLWAATWNRVTECCPVFPVCTLFYNHQGRKLFDNVSERINSDMYVYLGSWGHYDDEVRQLNNALHNFYRGLKKLPPKASKPCNVPIFIFGSGPSVDDRIDTVRRLRDKAIVVSCGTALRSLEHHGVKPDFHVELESDYNVYRLTSKIDADYLKSIPIIAPSHINPMVFTLFGDARYYFKRENPIAQLFGTEDETVANGTPTCTNAAIAVAMHLGFRNVYLFGMDFGFRNREKHHAAGSVYARNDIPAELKARRGFHPWELITVEGVHGDTIYTIATYFNAKRKAEHLIKDCLITYPDVRFHNCSDGAVIENSEWLSAEMLEARILEDEGVNADAKQKVMNFIFHPKAKALDTKVIASRQLFMRKKLEEVRDDVLMLIKDDYTDLRGFTNLVSAINAYVEHVLKSVEPGFYFFIRGTLRHFMHVGFTHMLGLSDEAARRQFYEDWRSTFSGVLEDIQGHFRQVICKPEFSLDSDPWVRQTINEPETYYGAP